MPLCSQCRADRAKGIHVEKGTSGHFACQGQIGESGVVWHNAAPQDCRGRAWNQCRILRLLPALSADCLHPQTRVLLWTSSWLFPEGPAKQVCGSWWWRLFLLPSCYSGHINGSACQYPLASMWVGERAISQHVLSCSSPMHRGCFAYRPIDNNSDRAFCMMTATDLTKKQLLSAGMPTWLRVWCSLDREARWSATGRLVIRSCTLLTPF